MAQMIRPKSEIVVSLSGLKIFYQLFRGAAWHSVVEKDVTHFDHSITSLFMDLLVSF